MAGGLASRPESELEAPVVVPKTRPHDGGDQPIKKKRSLGDNNSRWRTHFWKQGSFSLRLQRKRLNLRRALESDTERRVTDTRTHLSACVSPPFVQATRKATGFDEQALSTTCWSFAKLAFHDAGVQEVLFDEVSGRLVAMHPQGLANVSWSLARLQVQHPPLLSAISSQALALVSEMQAQHMTNTAWALVKLKWVCKEFMDAVAVHSPTFLAHCAPQNLGNLAWAFAKIPKQHGPMMQGLHF